MRVTHIIEQWLPLTQTWLASAIRHLPQPIDSTIVCRRVTPDAAPAPGALVVAPALVAGSIGKLVDRLMPGLEPGRIARVVASRNPALVHGHFGPAGWDGIAASRRAGVPLIVSFYGLDVDAVPRNARRWRARYQRVFEVADRVLALGPWMAGRLVASGADPDRIVIHHLGVPVSEIGFLPRRWTGERPLRILIAASFREKKGIPVALAALAEIRRRTPLAITLVGDAANPREERERVRIFDTIDREVLGDAVRHLGFVSHQDLLRLAADHDLLVAASMTASDGDSEGTPMTLVELAATGIVVVTTRHADIPEIVVEGRTGFLAEPDDRESLVVAIERAIAEAQVWPAIGEAARAHAANEFDSIEQGRRLAALYASLGR